MTNLVRKMGHVIKHSPEIIKKRYIISKLKHQKVIKKIKKSRIPKIVVSLTSYKKRFNTLDICIKSIFNQTLLPDRLILYLSNNEKIEDIPQSVKDLQDHGLEIKFVDLDLKPHKKYFYAMNEFPDSIIITIDDDVIYDKYLIDELVRKHNEFPNCIVAARARKISFNKTLLNYTKWALYNEESFTTSFIPLATGVGGILYPPHVLNKDILLNVKKVKEYLTVDDLWLKNVEILSKVPIVLCNPKIDKNRIEIPSAQAIGLSRKNVEDNENDYYLRKLNKEYNFLAKLKQSEKDLLNEKYE